MLSFSQQSVFLSLGQYHSWWIISPRGYHSPSSQCFHHWIDTTLGGLLVSEGIILPVVSVSITGSTPLLVDYQSPMVSFSQQSVFLSLGQYHSWWIISSRGYHSPSSQCSYHWVNTTLGGLLVPEGIILPVVSVAITGSIPLLVDYWSPRVSFSQQLVFLSLGQYNSWWIISPRGYHSPSSQCFYHWVNTTLGGLLVPEGIILPVVSVSITGSIPPLVDYWSPRVSFSQQLVFLSLGQYNSWWIISPRCYHSPSSQCFYHWVNTTLGGLLVPEGIILPVVSVSITGSIPLLVDYQSPRVSFSQQSGFISLGQHHSWWIISPRGYHSPSSQCFYHKVNTTLGGLLVPRVSFSQQSVFLSLGQHHSWWIISPRWYHSPSSQCFYHWVNTTLGGLLVPEGIILPVVSVSITGSIQLLVDYQSPRVSFSQQSVFLSLGQYNSWWIISPRCYHSPSSQCFYHWVNTTLGGLLVPEGIILPVVSVSITGSIPLLVDYQSLRVSFSQLSVFLSLGQYHSWWIISPRGYHSPSSQCFYHWVNTTLGGLLVPEVIILPVVSVSVTGSIPLLVDYQSPRLSFSQQLVFLSLGQYHSWWIISSRGYHSPSSQCFYHWVNTTLGGLLVSEVIILPVVSVSITGSIPLLVDYQSPEGIILPVVTGSIPLLVDYQSPSIILPVSVSITGSIPLLVDYQSPRVSFSQQSVFLSLGQYHSWWIISPRGYHSPSSQCFYHWVNTTLGGLLVPRGYHSPSSQCFYHWVNTTLGGLLVPEGIILPVVSVSITGSIPLLVDYQSPRISFSQQSGFISLSQHHSWWIISPRGYHSPSSQCFYHWVNTTLGGLLVPEGIILPVVSVSITGSIPLLVDYQSPRVSFSQQSVFPSLGQYHSWWIISLRGYHSPSSQCFYHWVNTTLGGLLVPEGIILPVVSVSITGSIQLLVDYQSPMLSFSQQSVFLSLGQYNSWWIISPRGYHSPSSQCFYHWVNTTLGGLLVPEGIILPVVILPVVSVSITGSIPLLVDYQSPRLSFSQQSVFLSLGQYHSWWIISPRTFSQQSVFLHWVNTTLGGLLVPEGIILPVVSVSITGSIPLLVDYQSPMVSFSQQCVYITGSIPSWWIISPRVITGSIPLLVDYCVLVFLSLGQYNSWWIISP